MRLLATTLFCISNLLALQKSDVVGMWKVTTTQDSSTTQEEFFFTADGGMELRSESQTVLGDLKTDVSGAWTVQGDSVYGKITSGWVASPFGVEAITPQDTFKGQKAELIAGNPKKIRITDCSDSCTVQDMIYVGAAKQFTLPVVNASTSVRLAARKPAFRRSGPDNSVMRLLRGRAAFDARGRLLEIVPR